MIRLCNSALHDHKSFAQAVRLSWMWVEFDKHFFISLTKLIFRRYTIFPLVITHWINRTKSFESLRLFWLDIHNVEFSSTKTADLTWFLRDHVFGITNPIGQYVRICPLSTWVYFWNKLWQKSNPNWANLFFWHWKYAHLIRFFRLTASEWKNRTES